MVTRPGPSAAVADERARREQAGGHEDHVRPRTVQRSGGEQSIGERRALHQQHAVAPATCRAPLPPRPRRPCPADARSTRHRRATARGSWRTSSPAPRRGGPAETARPTTLAPAPRPRPERTPRARGSTGCRREGSTASDPGRRERARTGRGAAPRPRAPGAARRNRTRRRDLRQQARARRLRARAKPAPRALEAEPRVPASVSATTSPSPTSAALCWQRGRGKWLEPAQRAQQQEGAGGRHQQAPSTRAPGPLALGNGEAGEHEREARAAGVALGERRPEHEPGGCEGLGLAVREGVEGEPRAEEDERDGGQRPAHAHRLGLKRRPERPDRARKQREQRVDRPGPRRSNALRKRTKEEPAGEREGEHAQEARPQRATAERQQGQQLGEQRGQHALDPHPGKTQVANDANVIPKGRLAARGPDRHEQRQAPRQPRAGPIQRARTGRGRGRDLVAKHGNRLAIHAMARATAAGVGPSIVRTRPRFRGSPRQRRRQRSELSSAELAFSRGTSGPGTGRAGPGVHTMREMPRRYRC